MAGGRAGAQIESQLVHAEGDLVGRERAGAIDIHLDEQLRKVARPRGARRVLAQLRADAPHGGQRGLLCRGVHAGTPVVRARHAWVARIGLGADGARVVLRERAVVHGGKGRKVKRRRFARAGGIVASDDRGGDLVGHRDVEFGGEPRLQLDRGDLCVAANVERLKRVANRRELLAELLYHELLGRSGVGVRHGHVGRGCGEGVRCLSLRGWAAAGRCTSLYDCTSTRVPRYS